MYKLSKEEFVSKFKRDTEEKRKHKDSDFYGYVKDNTLRKRRAWNVKLGGFRW